MDHVMLKGFPSTYMQMATPADGTDDVGVALVSGAPFVEQVRSTEDTSADSYTHTWERKEQHVNKDNSDRFE